MSWWCMLSREKGLVMLGQQREVPQVSVGGTSTGDDGVVLVCDCHGVGIKGGDASSIAELSNRDEGARCEVGENMRCACSKGKIREIEFGRMAGVNDTAIEKSDGCVAAVHMWRNKLEVDVFVSEEFFEDGGAFVV
jgi:hypothetical protein